MKNLLTVLLLLSSIVLAQQVKFSVFLTDNSDGKDTLYFGLDPTATNGLDPSLGEQELPPAPPSGVFDVRFVGDDIGLGAQLGQGTKKDYRQGTSVSQDSIIHELKYQPGNGTSIVVKWNFPSTIKGYLTDLLGGILYNKVMTGNDSLVVTNPGIINKLKMAIKYSLAPTATITLTAPNGGENWLAGSQQNITWNQTGITTVKLEYTTNNGTSWIIIGTAPALAKNLRKELGLHPKEQLDNPLGTNGVYAWTVPNTPSTQCKVRVSDNSNAAVNDMSDNIFTISSGPPPTDTWATQTSGVTTDLQSVTVVNSTTAYVAGSAGTLLKTTNGGSSWVSANTGLPATYDLLVIKAIDANTVVVGGADAAGTAMWRTTNGGGSWTQVYTQAGGFIDGIWFFDANNGFAHGDPVGGQWTLLKSTNGGASWTASGSLAQAGTEYGYNNSLYWANSNVGYFGTNNTRIYKTTNGGTSWTFNATTALSSYSIGFENETNGLAGITAGNTNRTTNGGTNWVASATGGSGSVYGLSFLAGSEYFATSGTNVYRTTNQGVNWAVSNTGTGTNYAIDVKGDAINATGWVVGAAGKIIKFSRGGVVTPSITVTAPNGGENWVVGTQQNITWTSTNVTNVKIEYSTNNGTSYTQIVASVPATPATYSWTVPNTPTTQALVRISDASNATVNDVSNAVFTISAAPSITVTAPNGGENWTVGTQQNITWTSTNVTNVKIEYSTNNGTSYTQIVASVPATPATYSWTVPNTPTTQALVRISDASNAAVNDVSNAVFTISAAPSVTVTAPNGGENWGVGTQQNITWTSTNVTNLKIEYSTNNGTSYTQIVASVPATPATYSWTVPNTPTTQALVRISDASNATVNDVSNAVFTISAAPSITVTAPNGGENWTVGTQQNITWTSTNVTNVKIEYSTNNGTSYTQIVASVPATPATYSWTVPNTPTTQALVRISDASNAAVNDVSNAVFSIVAAGLIAFESPIVIVDNGTGRDTLRFGLAPSASDGIDPALGEQELPPAPPTGVFDIRFVGDDIGLGSLLGQGIKKDYRQGTSTFSGVKIHELKYQPGSGTTITVSWNFPAGVTGKLQDLLGGLIVNDTMVGAGSKLISQPGVINKLKMTVYYNLGTPTPSVTVTAPNGGENWTVGSNRNITWTSSNITNVKIEYSTNNGTSYTTIIASTPAAAGTYAWTVPNTPTTQALVKISDASNATVFDVSNAVFTISPAVTGSFKVLYPVGGELLMTNTTHIFAWKTTNVTGNVNLQLSTNGGTSYSTIVQNIANNGFYAYPLTSVVGNQYRFRVQSVDNPTIVGSSDSNFTVIPVISVYRDMPLLVSDGFFAQQLRAGINSNATNGIDPLLGEFELPPTPVAGVFDARYIGTDIGNPALGQGVLRDFRQGDSTTTAVVNHEVKYQLGPLANQAATDITIYWFLPTGVTGVLQGVVDTTVKVNMSGSGKYTVINPGVQNRMKVMYSYTGTGPTQTVTVTAPNGGENWPVASVRNITWTSSNITNVKIEYTTNNGTSWTTIIASTPAAAGTYAWTVPNTPSTQCKVKISDAADGIPADESNAVFTISAGITITPIINLRSNNANGVPVDSGKVFTVRGVVTVGNEFNSPSYLQDGTGGIALYSRGNLSPKLNVGDSIQVTATLTHFNGLTQFMNPDTSTFQKLATGRPITPRVVTIAQINSQAWNGVEALEGLLVRVNGVTVVGASGNWTGNTNYNITNGTDTVQFRVTNGTTLVGQPIPTGQFSVIGALGQYKVGAPYQGGYQILGRYAEDVITGPVTAVTVTSPNGGENWVVGSVRNITWTSTGVTNVKIEYTTNNGTSWTTIIATTPAAAGTYAWTVPNTPTTQAKVRISDASNAAVNDMSDNVFTISAPLVLGDFSLVTPPNNARIEIRENVPALVVVKWTKSANATAYIWKFRGTPGGAVLLEVPVTDTTISAPEAYLYEALTGLGLRDSVQGTWEVWATNGLTEKKSLQTFNIKFVLKKTVNVISQVIPTEFKLGQNYPNPFNPSTIISYELPKDGFVKISVYNLAGEKVADLVNDYRRAGIYNVKFDAKQLNSGIYIYKMITGEFVSTKKMIYIK